MAGTATPVKKKKSGTGTSGGGASMSSVTLKVSPASNFKDGNIPYPGPAEWPAEEPRTVTFAVWQQLKESAEGWTVLTVYKPKGTKK